MWIITVLGISISCLVTITNGVRLCVSSQSAADCAAMEAETRSINAGIICVTAADRYECLHKIIGKEADVMRADPEDVFLAKELFQTKLHVIAETRSHDEKTESYRYEGVAVVRKAKIKTVSDLRGSKSCHTGYGRTAGWNIPFSHLLEKGQIQLKCDQKSSVVEHDLHAASSYFGLACIPGKWVPDKDTDAKLKKSYNNLCTMCGNPGTCDDEDIHSGYVGALRCLVDSHGDVAWTKLSAVSQFFKMRDSVTSSDFGLLCPDGRLLELDDPVPCHWAAKPWGAWLSRAVDEDNEEIVGALSKVLSGAMPPVGEGTTLRPWAKKVLGTDSPSVIHRISPAMTPYKFLDEPGYYTTIERLGCPEEPVKLCITNSIAYEKCQALQQVLKSRRIRPPLACVSPSSSDDCLATVASGDAHITSADGGDIYRGHMEYGTIPVVTEKYGLLDASYFAVAVVRADSGITSFQQLRGKKSCHTGIDKTAGWKIPVVTLLEAELLENGNCDYAGELGRFFSSSCAPGAKDPKYDPAGTNPDSLCDLCVGNYVGGASGPSYAGGDTEGRCKRNAVEAFYGYTGAFRCLAQGGGDVAFVKHSTVAANTNGNNNASWTQGLHALDFKLLCKVTGTADVVDYNTCNLARVPAHKIITGIKSDKTMLEEIRILLLRASDQLPKGQDVFNMFGTFQGRSDIIFKDSATALVNIRDDTFHKSLDNVYYRALTELSACTPKSSTSTGPSATDQGNKGSSSATSFPLMLLVLISLLPIMTLIS